MTDVVSSVVTPNQQLIGFQKVDIAYVFFLLFQSMTLIEISSYTSMLSPGKSTTVSIKVLSSQLAVWSLKNSWVVEPGVFNIKVGTSDQTFAATTLTVH